MREAEWRQPCRGVSLVPAAVTRLLDRRAVISQPVGLDHKTEFRPEEVDKKTVDAHPRVRCRETDGFDEPKEPAFELRVRQPEDPAIKQAAKRGDAALTGHLVKRPAQSFRVNEIALIGLVDCCFQLIRPQTAAQVRQGSGWTRDRHP
jgi:hypothetical protein